MLGFNSPEFQAYIKHVGVSEGGKSNSPYDTASKYVNAGQVHTNRGVIWPTYKSLAKKLGLNPSYESFLNLSKHDADLFIYQFYLDNGKEYKPLTGIAMTESAWASGPTRPFLNIQAALKKMGINVKNKKDSILEASKIDDKKLAIAISNEQNLFQKGLVATGKPEYVKNDKGWQNRVAKFQTLLNTVKVGTGIGLFVAIAAVFFLIYKRKG